MRHLRFLFSIHTIIALCYSFVGWAGHGGNEDISRAARLLGEYVSIESVSGNEKEAGLFLSSLAGEKGLHVRVFTDETDSYNFAASIYPLDMQKPNIIMLNHIDVVPAGEDSLWTYPPYAGVIADGFVWGRGSIDNKAMGIMHVLAIAEFVGLAEEADLPYNVTMLAVSGEEVGGAKGAGLVVEHFFEELNPVVVYGEGGTGVIGILEASPEKPYFGIEIAQKRGFWFSITSSDPASGHGSVPRQTYPAKEITRAAAALVQKRQPLRVTPTTRLMFRELGAHERGLRKLALRNIRFFRHIIGQTLREDPFISALLTNTITLTDLGSSAGAYNQVAHSAWATFDCRLLPGTSPEAFLEENKKQLGDLFDKVEVISQTPEAGISDTGYYYDALARAVTGVFSEAATGPILFPAHNDNAFFRAKGIPAYGLLPAILSVELIESIHNIDERMEIEALEAGIEVYIALLNLLLLE